MKKDPRQEVGSYVVCSSEVHPEQRVAASGMDDKQYGQSLVVAAAGSSRFALFTAFTTIKTTNATMRNIMTSLRKAP
jgi:hypothetical protein